VEWTIQLSEECLKHWQYPGTAVVLCSYLLSNQLVASSALH